MTAKANREYKNSMFVDLFFEDESAEKNDIELYNALHDEPLPQGTRIQKIRVDDVLYMNFRNDISFGIGGTMLVFGEHQSTVNENMPLRSLLYIGRAYEQLVPVRNRYKKKLAPLPKPEFNTFYNGEEDWGKERILRLSDAYKVKKGESMLDLTVKMININPHEHHELLKRCKVMREYGQFVDTVRKYQRLGDQDACKHAVEECIHQGILSEYLKKKGSEVVNMLIAEYDYDLDIEVQREEAYEEGRKAGRKVGERDKLIELTQKKLAKGKSIEEIADELEEKPEDIQDICNQIKEGKL